ncbi:response regulator [Agrobacterium vitis]|uniref:response regulator n=1 Tax=Agrobacterium vitis TaxID=373 RepID=UPI0012E89FEC|nr:response regulator [Agrobacterium vitis]MUZ65053.1 response regulator [Agrobacterium vitis]
MSGPTVLVVEDEILIRLDIVDALCHAGFQVIEAGCVAEAVAILETVPAIGAVFTDVDMPGKEDGLDLAHKVHTQWSPVAILVTSGHRRVQAGDLPGEGQFLPKPYLPAQVIANLNQMLCP